MPYPEPEQCEPLPAAAEDLPDSQMRLIALRDGALLVRRLVTPFLLERALEAVRSASEGRGWLEPGSSPPKARPGARLTRRGWDDPEYLAFHHALFGQSAFWALGADPGVRRVLTAILGSSPIPAQGDICRVVFPKALDHTTKPHQDAFYTPGNLGGWTVWIPLGDCPLELGPLAVVLGSHRACALRPHAGEVGELGTTLEPGERWSTAACALGDALFFAAHTVHGALPNRSQDRVRLSIDYRYRP